VKSLNTNFNNELVNNRTTHKNTVNKKLLISGFSVSKIVSLLNSGKLYITLQFILSAVFLYPYFRGQQILYGEGQFYISWSILLKRIGSAWMDVGLGAPAGQGIGNHFPILYIWSFMEKIGINFNHIQFLWFFLLFFLPYLFIFLLLTKVFKSSPFFAFLLSCFYICNPLFLLNWMNVNPWVMPIYYLLPLSWLTIGYFWNDNKKTFAVFVIIFFSSVYIFANPPYTVILFLGIIIASQFYSIYFDKKIISYYLFKKIIVIFTALMLANSFEIMSILISFSDSIAAYASAVNPMDILNQNSAFSHLDRVFSFRHLLSYDGTLSFLNRFINLKIFTFVLYIPITIVFFTALSQKKDEAVLYILSLLTFTIFFIKGVNSPLKSLFVFIFNNVPLFNMFKSAPEKFSPLYLFLMIVCITLLYKQINLNKKRVITLMMIVWLVIFSFPVYSFRLIPDLNHLGVKINHFYKKGFINETVNCINSNNINANVLSLPISTNYLILMSLEKPGKYLGLDPIINNLNKGSVEAFYNSPSSNLLFESILNKGSLKYLPLFNIQYIILNKNILSGFGFFKGADRDAYKKMLNKEEFSCKSIDDVVDLYKVNNFLPLFYVPDVIMDNDSFINNRMDDSIVSSYAFYPYEDITARNIPFKARGKQIIEFGKINPIKYRVRVHQADDVFPLVFSKNFHDEWKIYLAQAQNSKLKTQSQNLELETNEYKILDGNEEDQASREELEEFIENGWITNLGDLKEKEIKHKKWENGKEKLDYIEKYKIDFISKNFHGTIQNDNLPKGKFWETWFKKPVVSEDKHLMANGYANSWIVNPADICEGNDKCVKNPDGTYDFELVVEFWPQRLFYIGLGISGATLLSCVGYLIWDWRRRRKDAKISQK